MYNFLVESFLFRRVWGDGFICFSPVEDGNLLPKPTEPFPALYLSRFPRSHPLRRTFKTWHGGRWGLRKEDGAGLGASLTRGGAGRRGQGLPPQQLQTDPSAPSRADAFGWSSTGMGRRRQSLKSCFLPRPKVIVTCHNMLENASYAGVKLGKVLEQSRCRGWKRWW